MKTATPFETEQAVDDVNPNGEESTPRRGLGKWLSLGVVVVAVGAAAAWWVTTSGDDGTAPTAAAELEFAATVRTNLVEVEELDGTLGRSAGDAVVSRSTGSLTASAPVGTTVSAGDTLFAIDGEPTVLLYGDVPAWRDLGLTPETEQVLAPAGGTVTALPDDGTTIIQGVALYEVGGEPVIALYGDVPAYRAMRDLSENMTGTDVAQLEQALVDLGYDPDGEVTVDDEFTFFTEQMVERWQEDIGVEVDGIVDLGDVVFISGPVTIDAAVAAVGGSVQPGAPVVTIITGFEELSGDDVRQLETGLAALGYTGDGSLLVDGRFSAGTEQAVIQWQAAIGAEEDGVVNLGEVVFLPAAIRVDDQLTAVGSSVNNGTPVVGSSSADIVVTVDLATDDQALLSEGTTVTVVLPAGVEASAVVQSVATVATTDQQGNVSFEVIITLDDTTVAAGLDEAPVNVEVVTDSAEDVLAVPVTSLLALREGGYAVEVDRGNGAISLVPVEPGMYADGLVEVSAPGLSAGDMVVVP